MMKSPLLNRSQAKRQPDDSGAAMITALLAILVTAMFSIVMLGVIMSQITPTQLQQATTRTVFAAEAGVNAAVGQIRNAEDSPDGAGKVYGDVSQLPCTATGTVSSSGTALAYQVQIRYFTADPTTQSDAWRASHALPCTAGYGPSADPTHALIESSGTGLVVQNAPGDLDRTIEVVYTFQVSNSNIPGGYIFSWDRSTPGAPDRFCLEATSVSAGANVRYVAAADCGDNDARQLWVYDKDYRIKLASSTVASSGADPLCVTATPNGSTAVRATLQLCDDATSASRWNQLWSWMGDASWEGENSDISDYSSYYLSTGTGTIAVGSYLQVWNKTGSAEWQSYNPDPRVGAGRAGIDTHQIVNYYEFGRCADVTHGTIGESQMIVYPCKQDPSIAQTKLNWNHKWYYDEPTNKEGTSAVQQIYVNNGSKYCLTSTDSDGGFATFKSCSSSNTGQKWTRYAEMLSSYSDSWVFKDGYGRCLDLGPWYHFGQSSQESWSTLVTQQCNGTLSQKWNAPADISVATLGGYWELP